MMTTYLTDHEFLDQAIAYARTMSQPAVINPGNTGARCTYRAIGHVPPCIIGHFFDTDEERRRADGMGSVDILLTEGFAPNRLRFVDIELLKAAQKTHDEIGLRTLKAEYPQFARILAAKLEELRPLCHD